MNTKLKKIAGQQLQLLRLEKNLTQEQMSEKLNLSTSAYCKIEYGETDLTLTRLDKIAKVLGISALSLFSHIDKRKHFQAPTRQVHHSTSYLLCRQHRFPYQSRSFHRH